MESEGGNGEKQSHPQGEAILAKEIEGESDKSVAQNGHNVELPQHHSNEQQEEGGGAKKDISMWHRFLYVLDWKPPWTRWNPEEPPVFSMAMNLLFAFACTFTVANLYYSHPILNILAADFNVSYEVVSRVPTLAQAGYAAGLLFLCPLGDLLKRRPFVLGLVWLTATLWIGLCVTKNFSAFLAITFITSMTTVTPQLMLPLVGDLAPPHRRATALSVVSAGFLLGILIARLLSGIITNYTSWRVVYWVAFGAQYLVFILLWIFMPDYPSTNPEGLNYFRLLWDVVYMMRKHPVLVQACLIVICNVAPFTSYWTTLTFLLSSRYHYDSLVIGLWALIGIGGLVVTPFYGRLVIDKYVPLFSAFLGQTFTLIGIVVGTYSGTKSVIGVGFEAFLLDLGLQSTQVANRSAIYACEPKARNRVNTAYMVCLFLGQIMGTSAGNKLYAEGGWVAAGSLSVGLVGFSYLILFARGPYESGWIGWSGGYAIRKKDKTSADGKTSEQAHHTRPVRSEAVEKEVV